MKKIFFGLLFLLIIILNIFPRSIEVLSNNYVFGFDQGRDYLAVKDIVIHHKFTLIGSEIGAGAAGFQGIFQGPLHYYLLAIPFIIFHGDPFGGVLLMLIFGLSSIFLGFYLGKKIFNTIGGMLIGLLLAISPPLVSQSRFVWNSHPSTFFILLTFLCAYNLSGKKKKIIFLTSFLAALVYNFEIAIAIPLCLTVLVYSLFVIRFKTIKEYLILLSGYVVAIIPFFLFESRHNFMGIRGVISYFLTHHVSSSSKQTSYFLSHLGSFSYNFFDTLPGLKIFPQVFFLAIFVGGIIFAVLMDRDKKRRKFMCFLLLLPLVSFMIFMFLKNLVYPFYLIELTLSYIFLFVYSMWILYENRQYMPLSIFALFYIFFVSTAISSTWRVSVNDYHDYGGTAKIKGKIDAINYIYKDAAGRQFGIIAFAPPVYTYDTDYLIWWYGSRKYGYLPYQEKKGTFYLLIEPDPSKTWSYQGWLETVIKTGTIEKTTYLPSGYIVQKRIIE